MSTTIPSLATVPAPYASNPIISLTGDYARQVYDFAIVVNPSNSAEMWMFASVMDASGIQRIGRFSAVTSAVENNTATWTYDGRVLLPGTGAQWDATNGLGGVTGIRLGSIVYTGGTFYLYYNSDAAVTDGVGLATGTDGFAFTKSASNPILTPSGNGRNDGQSVSQPAVMLEGASTWTMIYSYVGPPILPGLRYATSSDGIAWTKGGSGDIFSLGALYCEFHQIVKLASDDYLLLCEAGNTTNSFQIWVGRSKAVTGPYTSPTQPWLSPSGTVSAYDRYHVATAHLFQMPSGNLKLFYCAAGDLDQPYVDNTWTGCVADVTALAQTFTTSLISAWSLDEASGSRADSHGTNTLTDNNTVPGSALVIGNGAYFQTANSEYLSCASNASLQMGDIDATWAFWVQLQATHDASLVSKDVDSPGSSRDYTIDLETSNLRFYVNGGGGGLLVSTAAPSIGAPAHLLIVWHDATANTLNLQLDNGSVASVSTGGTAPQTSSAQFRIGARAYAGFEGYADAVIDEVRYWKRTLTTLERSEQFSRGVGLPYGRFAAAAGASLVGRITTVRQAIKRASFF